MGSRHHYRRPPKAPPELDMTTFLNLMVVLVPFLLITAVFSRITIVELSLPSSAGGAAPADPGFRVEVIVRDGGLELANGRSVIAKMPKIGDEYDLETLTEHVLAMKRDHPDSNGASVLLEPHIEYDHLIQVMDAVRSTSVPAERVESEAAVDAEGEAPMMRMALFTDISIGDAP